MLVQMSQQVNGNGNADSQAIDAAHKLASTHIQTPGLSASDRATPDSETELHSPHPVPQFKPAHPSHLHPLTTLSENPSPDHVSLNDPHEPPHSVEAHSVAPSASSRGPESGAYTGFQGSKAVSDQAFPFPNGESTAPFRLSFSA